MSEIPSLVDNRVLRPAQTALALNLVSKMDLLRLKAIARVYARGLVTQVTWEDLLQEALTRVIAGSRRKPEGITMVAFVAGVLRSLRADYSRRATRESGGTDALHQSSGIEHGSPSQIERKWNKSRGTSGRRNAETPDERLRDDELVIYDFQRKRSKTAGGRALDDRCRLARIIF